MPDPLLRGPFRGSAAVAAGLLTAEQLRGRRFTRLFRDVHVPARFAVDHRLRTEAAVCVLFPDAVVTGHSAAVLWQLPVPGPAEDVVELTRPPGTHPVRVSGVRVRRARLDPGDVVSTLGLRVTTPEATALDLAGRLRSVDAVVLLDAWAAARMLDLPRARALAAGRSGRGSTRARVAADRADGLAGSPQETRLRLLLAGTGLPPPVAQFRVVHEGRFVARVDFGWPGHRVALEYDGLWHAEAGQFARDRQRLNALGAAGWRVVFATSADLQHPGRLLALLTTALAG